MCQIAELLATTSGQGNAAVGAAVGAARAKRKEAAKEAAAALVAKQAEVLGRVPIFAKLAQTVRAEIALTVEEVVLGAGEHFVTEGDGGDCMFVVEDGAAEAVAGGAVVFRYAAGGWFGELALCSPEAKRAVRSSTRVVDRRSVRSHANVLAQTAGWLLSISGFVSRRRRSARQMARAAALSYIGLLSTNSASTPMRSSTCARGACQR